MALNFSIALNIIEENISKPLSSLIENMDIFGRTERLLFKNNAHSLVMGNSDHGQHKAASLVNNPEVQ